MLNMIMKAKKRIWFVVPKIEYLLYKDILIEKASVQAIAIDERSTKEVEDFIHDKNQAIENAKRQVDRTRLKSIMFKIGSNITLVISLIFLALASYIWYAADNPNAARPIPLLGMPSVESAALVLITASILCIVAVFLDELAKRSELQLKRARTEFMKLQRAIAKEKEIDVRDVETKFKSAAVNGI